jgi:uncharacterized protein with PQ loop repeat
MVSPLCRCWLRFLERVVAFSSKTQMGGLYRLKSAREISLPFNLLFLMGGVCWLVYGISKDLVSVIVSNAVNLFLVLAMLYAKLKYGRQS